MPATLSIAGRRGLATLLMALAAWLSGCGPGVGGTGTGETEGLAYFDATATPVCRSALATPLGCAVATDAGVPVPVDLADAAQAPQVSARALANHIDLAAACTGLRFRGVWGESAALGERYYGVTGPDGATAPATLQVQADATGLQVTLRDAQGAVLLGPRRLQVVPAAPAPGACG